MDFRRLREHFVASRLKQEKRRLVKEWQKGEAQFLKGKGDVSHFYITEEIQKCSEDADELLRCVFGLAKKYNVEIHLMTKVARYDALEMDIVYEWAELSRDIWYTSPIKRVDILWRRTFTNFDFRELYKNFPPYEDVEERLGMCPPVVDPELPTAEDVVSRDGPFRGYAVKKKERVIEVEELDLTEEARKKLTVGASVVLPSPLKAEFTSSEGYAGSREPFWLWALASLLLGFTMLCYFIWK